MGGEGAGSVFGRGASFRLDPEYADYYAKERAAGRNPMGWYEWRVENGAPPPGGTTPPPTPPPNPNPNPGGTGGGTWLPPGVDPYYGLTIGGLPGGTGFNVATPNMTWRNSLPTVMPPNSSGATSGYSPLPFTKEAKTPQVPTTPPGMTYNNPYNTNPYLPLANPFALVLNNGKTK